MIKKRINNNRITSLPPLASRQDGELTRIGGWVQVVEITVIRNNRGELFTAT